MLDYKTFIEKYNIKLNPQQLSAVTKVDGPVLLLAVPGSGKTTVLVTRIAYMVLCCGIAPESILTLTYTRASARDMKERYLQLFGSSANVSVPESDDFGHEYSLPAAASNIEFRTINSICVKIINYYAAMTGRTPYRIAEEGIQAQIITAAYQAVQGEYPSESERNQAMTLIAFIKNMMLSEKEIEEMDTQYDIIISRIYSLYQKAMKERRLMDFDDQLVTAYKLLEMVPAVREHFQNQYQYICVDEAQDTSKIQHKIIALLAADNENLFMVGDEDQSIYGFRAAYPEALLHFEKDHAGAAVLLMEKNYRSSETIVQAADRFIKKNTLRHDKHMQADRPVAANVNVIETSSRRGQYKYLAKVAQNCQKETAVLYRDNGSALPLIDQLEREHIPYRLAKNDISFFGTRTVNDILNIMRFALEPDNAELFLQIYYRIKLYLNKDEAYTFAEMAKKQGIPVLKLIRQHGAELGVSGRNQQRYGSRNERRDLRIREVETALHSMKEELPDAAISRILKDLGYAAQLDGNGVLDEKVYILKTIASRTESIGEFLERMAYLKSVIENHEDNDSLFLLSTIHMSKGLEYDCVYLIDVVDGLFPSVSFNEQLSKDAAALALYEEERRIFYVGITRARNELHIFRMPIGSAFIEDLGVTEKKKPVSAGRNAVELGSKTKTSTKTGIGFRDPYKATLWHSEKKSPFVDPLENDEYLEHGFYEFMDNLAEGLCITHKVYGEGCITEVSEKSVAIEFSDGSIRKMNPKVLYKKKLLE